jgi:sugar phosphate isomerase/epimerase
MKLAVSNIAWPAEQDEAVAELLRAEGVGGVEVAPTKLWPRPAEASAEEIEVCRRWWETRGLAIVAAQALLFGRPELTLFDDAETRGRTRDYLRAIVRVCGLLGAGALVFGSPKNRRRGGREPGEVWPVAVDFFGDLAETAEAEGTAVVIEANPPEYGADFVTRAAEAITLVQAVNHPGLRLHLDTACMALADDPAAETVAAGSPLLRHFHASEPFLAPLGVGGIDHAAAGMELRRRGYAHWVSVEMKETTPFTLDGLRRAIRHARRHYAD